MKKDKGPKIVILGIDPAFANMGFVQANYYPKINKLFIKRMYLIKTNKTKHKTVRVASDNLERAKYLYYNFTEETAGCDMVIGEVPTGTQNAKAATGLGIVVGILASCQKPFIEVSPKEVKLTVSNSTKKIPKKKMIEWAVKKYPKAKWLRRKYKGKIKLLNDNEHLADAIAAIEAGIKTEAFKTAMSIISKFK